MSPASHRRPSRSTLLVVGVLVIGIAGIVYSRVRQAPAPVAAASVTLAGADAPVLRGTPDPKAQALLPPGGWPDSAAISATTRKGSGLADAITQALNTQIESGTYAQALQRWNLAEEAVPQSQTNPPGLPGF
ncbi:hypothetical protein [Stenotrophomonas sp.]|uniref:hypothetical protein n=1 Tax=Stenotrophomonas sp. TaxID=69392 RepID=UPI0028A16505|nr:hypothetical protein [Stenotrophomonas sp.]